MHKPDHRVRSAACAVLAAMAFGGPACAVGGGGGGGGAVDGEIVVLMRARSEVAPLLLKHQLSLIGRFGARPIYRLKVIGKAKVKEKIDALRAYGAKVVICPTAVPGMPAPTTWSRTAWR